MTNVGRPPNPSLIDKAPWGRGRFYVIAYFVDCLNIYWRKEDKKAKGSKGGRPSSMTKVHQLRDEICRRFKLSKGELKALAMKEERLRLEQKEEEQKNFERMMRDPNCWSPWDGF